jgi:hypothetical protein
MASVGQVEGGLDRIAHEGSSVGTVFQHPRAPKMLPKELPAIDQSIQQHPIAINFGEGQWIPHNLLFHNDIRPGIDYRLAYSNEPRAIAQPSFTCIPNTWGAVGTIVMDGGDETKGVGFEEAFDPTTRPLVTRMVILTDTGNRIIADAGQGRSSVTVVDVQAVINWMKETRTSSGINNLTRRFSRLVRMIDDDGSEAELEVWVWKGLRSLSTDMIHWHLHLCEA